MYEYNASVVEVIDGDTVVLAVDLGFRIYSKMHMRLSGINTPELHGVPDPKPGRAAKEYLESLVKGKDITIQTEKDRHEKYGRILALLYLPGDPLSINERMIRAGFAVRYDGGKR